jgi:hypothetical protein
MIRKSKNKCSLLPYIRENVYGLSTSSGQFIGWEIKKFNIENQWKHSTGKGVTVAVIDTGCDIDHPDIKNNIVQGKNFIEKDKDPIDRNGHGTHVAGTIAAENNGIGMVGVAPDAKIMPVKALKDDGSGDIQTVVSAILWSVDNNADLITMSLGSPNPHPDLESAINYAASKGVIIFCAAVNSGEQTDIMYPAKFNHTIAIGAIDKDLKRTEFTCSGETLDLKTYEADMRHLIDNYIQAVDPKQISPFGDITLIDLIVKSGISDAVNSLPKGIKGSRQAVSETIENNIRQKIIKEHLIDPAYYENMSTLLNEIIKERRSNALNYEEYLKKIADIATKVQSGTSGETPATIKTPAQRSLFNNLKKNESLALEIHSAINLVRPDGWRGNEPKERVIKQKLFQILNDELEVERIFEIIKLQQEY